MTLTVERLKEVLIYNKDTGVFVRNTATRGHYEGSIAGCVGRRGYIQICIDKKQYRANRLAWLYMTGEFPELYVDHINGDTSDNRWENLRLANASQNVMNSSLHKEGTSTNIKGIYVDKNGSIHAQVVKDAVRFRKIFREMSEAIAWVQEIRLNLHGEFAKNV